MFLNYFLHKPKIYKKKFNNNDILTYFDKKNHSFIKSGFLTFIKV